LEEAHLVAAKRGRTSIICQQGKGGSLSVSLKTYDPNTQLLRLRGEDVVPEARKWWKNGWLARKVTALFSDRYSLSRISAALYDMGPENVATVEEILEKIRTRLKSRFASNPAKLSRLRQRLLPPAVHARGELNPNEGTHDLGPELYENYLKLCENLSLRGCKNQRTCYSFLYQVDSLQQAPRCMTLWFNERAELVILDEPTSSGRGGEFTISKKDRVDEKGSPREIKIRVFTDTTSVVIQGCSEECDDRFIRRLLNLATQGVQLKKRRFHEPLPFICLE
jgi:hypothetical protein